MLTFTLAGETVGVVGGAVGAPFAVMIAEQMFASGCRLAVSLSPAVRIIHATPEESLFVVVDKALRDEGTSYHYLSAEERYSHADPELADLAANALAQTGLPTLRGAVWTTDAPYRRTPQGMSAAAQDDALAVDMESAALYAFSKAQRRPIICLAHVTTDLVLAGGEYKKGVAYGQEDVLRVLAAVLQAWRQHMC